MRKIGLMVAALLLVAPVFAQNAKVMVLDADEAANAKALYAEKAQIEKKIEILRESIKENYLQVAPGSYDAAAPTYCNPLACMAYRNGFPGGEFEFSEDFRYIVPSTPKPAPTAPVFPNWFTATPAVNCVTCAVNEAH